MNLYNSIDNYCSNYAIPLTTDTVGYLQFYHKFNSNFALDINTVKYFQVDKNGVETPISALNTIVEYLGSSNFHLISQGLQLLETQNFRVKIEVTTNNGNTEIFYSDMFTFEPCGNSSALIPCLVDGQQYSVNGNYIGDIEVKDVVYQSWQIPSEKKYTPVVFIRNLSFRRKTNTIEYRKLNNKPLRTTLKRDYKLKCEPIPSTYIDQIDEVFAFGKVNLLDKTFAFETYNVEVIDENDCCSLYRINATAYEESKIRLLCSNNCTILSPVDCEDYEPKLQGIQIYPCERTMNETGEFIEDITYKLLQITGLDISEIQDIIDNNDGCKWIEVQGDEVIATLDSAYEQCFFKYEVCGVENTIRIFADGYLQEPIPEIISVTYYQDVQKYSINGTFGGGLANGQYEVIYTDLNTGIVTVYGVVVSDQNQFLLSIPEGSYSFQIRTYCEGNLSNIFVSTKLICYKVIGIYDPFDPLHPEGGTVVYVDENGDTITIENIFEPDVYNILAVYIITRTGVLIEKCEIQPN